MKTLTFFALITLSTLSAEPMGSIHDAWSDWVIDNQTRVYEEISQVDLADNDNFEPDEEVISDYN